MLNLNEIEERLLGEISPDILWQNVATLAQWQRVSGTEEAQLAAEYIRQRLEEYGLQTTVYEFDSLLSWPEKAEFEIRSPLDRQVRAITQSFAAPTAPEGLEGEAIYLGAAEESDFRKAPVAGKIVVLDGLASPEMVLLGQTYGVAGEIFVSGDEYARDFCISPVWGTATTKTAGLIPTIPMVSVARSDGDELRSLLEKGPVRVWMRTEVFRGWRTVPIVIGEVRGATDPEKFVLFSGHYCSWYYGAMDNGASNAAMLEVARIIARHQPELRRSVRVAFWPGHTQGRYSGSTWYCDRFWEDMHDHCVLHVNTDSNGARGADIYQARSTPDARDFAVEAIRDAIGEDASAQRIARAGDQSFWGCGVPTIMPASKVPMELAARLGAAARIIASADESPSRRKGANPWWWHTREDTIDKVDRAVLARDTRIQLLTTLRTANSPVLPLRQAPAARQIREALERYQSEAGERFDLRLAIDRAQQLEKASAELDRVAEGVGRQTGEEGLAEMVNLGIMAMARALVLINFTSNGPFDQDLAVSIPAVPLLEPARRLKEMDPSDSQTRYLVTELVRNRNKVAFYLRQALVAAQQTATALREAGA